MSFFNACFGFGDSSGGSVWSKKVEVDPEVVNDALHVREVEISQEEERLKTYWAAVNLEKETLAQQQADVQAQFASLERRLAQIEADEQKAKEREQAIRAKEVVLESLERERIKKQDDLEERLRNLADREAAVTMREIKMQLRETTLGERETQLLLREAKLQESFEKLASEEKRSSNQSMTDAPPAPSDGNDETEQTKELEEVLTISVDEGETIEETGQGLSEREILDKRLEEELLSIIKEAEETELDEPFEEEAIEALKTGARIVAYKKKYYDVFNDKFVYFPSIIKVMVDYTLIEEAEKHYFGEEDEFPLVYSAALRSVAATKLANDEHGEAEDMDEDYMAKLAMDVE